MCFLEEANLLRFWTALRIFQFLSPAEKKKKCTQRCVGLKNLFGYAMIFEYNDSLNSRHNACNMQKYRKGGGNQGVFAIAAVLSVYMWAMYENRLFKAQISNLVFD